MPRCLHCPWDLSAEDRERPYAAADRMRLCCRVILLHDLKNDTHRNGPTTIKRTSAHNLIRLSLKVAFRPVSVQLKRNRKNEKVLITK